MVEGLHVTLEKHLLKTTPTTHTDPNKGNTALVNWFYALYSVLNLFFLFWLFLYTHLPAYGTATQKLLLMASDLQTLQQEISSGDFFDRTRWERRSLLLCWPLAVNLLPMLCLNSELGEVWKVSVDPWPGSVNVEQSPVNHWNWREWHLGE